MVVDRGLAFLRRLETNSRINIALSKAAAVTPLIKADSRNPLSWEFSAFSQNGEDGIIDYLLGRILEPSRFFFEIGCSDGIENNTSWLAVARRYAGLMVEGDPKLAEHLKTMMAALNVHVKVVHCFVSADNIRTLVEGIPVPNPDFFSLDIDGNDLYIAEAVLKSGLHPRVLAVEYNSVFGPDSSISVAYDSQFDFREKHSSELYFGVSVTAWKRMLTRFGYKFLSVDSNGVNAFFIASEFFAPDFVEGLRGAPFRDNLFQLNKFGKSWRERFQIIQSMPYVNVE